MLPVRNFTVADVLGSLAAAGLYPLFVAIPGYAAAWLLNLFQFRRRTLLFRIAASVPLSIAICPLLIYFTGRFCSMAAVWVLFASSWIAFAAVTVWEVRRGEFDFRIPREWRVFGLIALAWTALAVFSSVDLQVGNRDYYPVTALDYSVRTEFIHSIATDGVPPGNPFFFPGHPAPLRYHYYWLLAGSMVDRAGGRWVGPRCAWIGGIVWCGFGFLALIGLYLRLFSDRGAAGLRRRMLAASLLVCATGLDILPTLALWGLRATGIEHAIFPSMEFWNEQVDGLVWSTLWEAHHVAGLIACLMSFLMLWEGCRERTAARRMLYAGAAGIALATAAGSSIHVSAVFAAFLAAWMGILLWRRQWSAAAMLSAAGLLALALAFPYGSALAGPGGGGPPVQLWVRPFYPADSLMRANGIGEIWRNCINALLLPVNYCFELGFFLAAALVWRKRRRAEGRAWTPAEIAVGTMIVSSATVCTFLRSSVIGNNDLGWRGFLIAQFGLLLWAVEVAADGRWRRRSLLGGMLVLGIAGTAYDVWILRFYPMLADRGIVAKVGWMGPDRQIGVRNYASREAFEWAARRTGERSVVQFNPQVYLQDTSAYLYAGRQVVAADRGCMNVFGGNPGECPPLLTKLNGIYAPPGQRAAEHIDGVCRDLPIDVIVARDTDAAWADPGSWVWRERPWFANAYVRLFRCGAGSGNLAQGR